MAAASQQEDHPCVEFIIFQLAFIGFLQVFQFFAKHMHVGYNWSLGMNECDVCSMFHEIFADCHGCAYNLDSGLQSLK